MSDDSQVQDRNALRIKSGSHLGTSLSNMQSGSDWEKDIREETLHSIEEVDDGSSPPNLNSTPDTLATVQG